MKYNVIRGNRAMFMKALSKADSKLDSFARTFVRKADLQNLWENIYCAVDDEENVCGAIITTYSKKEPKIANLQLLHTFSRYRGNTIGTILCFIALKEALKQNCIYFRVSAEPSAVNFYKKIGFVFQGEQKSKCQLSIFKIDGPSFKDGNYCKDDEIIQKAIFKKGKGGCIKIF